MTATVFLDFFKRQAGILFGLYWYYSSASVSHGREWLVGYCQMSKKFLHLVFSVDTLASARKSFFFCQARLSLLSDDTLLRFWRFWFECHLNCNWICSVSWTAYRIVSVRILCKGRLIEANLLTNKAYSCQLKFTASRLLESKIKTCRNKLIILSLIFLILRFMLILKTQILNWTHANRSIGC